MNGSSRQNADRPASDGLSIRAVFGTVALSACAVLVCIAFVDETGGLPFSMPRSWYANRPLWYFTMAAVFAAGCALLRDSGSSAALGERPDRFESVILYTRRNCHLCEDARSVLADYARDLPPIETIDVDSDPQLVEQFGKCVPVVEIDGKVRFRGQVNPVLLKRLIEHTPTSCGTGEGSTESGCCGSQAR